MTVPLHILFNPQIPPMLLQLLGAAALALCGYALYRRSIGAIGRAVVFALLLLALGNPSLVTEQREALKDTALIVVDDSASMQIGDRATQTAAALDALQKKLAAFPDLDTEILPIKGTEETDLFHAVEQKLTILPQGRIAGIIALTDGQIHDKPTAPFTAPFHALLAGHKDEIDRRLILKQAPAYGLVGKDMTVTLQIEDAPKDQSAAAEITITPDKGEAQTITLPVGKDVEIKLPISHAGQNLFVLSTPPLPNELTAINNTTTVSVNGIRDRLRVLLVSGQPHIGGRTWRNFLKADPAVDLVHFTILRSPNKFDMTPNTEMSLIAFPVHELFETRLQSFDLIILDRFRPQSLVPDEYLENIAKYVENGGALLASYATEEGIPPLTLSPLARILPAEPTGQLLTGSFVPDLSETGQRHPVTAFLPQLVPQNKWGPWFRQIDSRTRNGDVLMTGINHQPLLVLSHVGKGRVAQFLSDQFWLWARNEQGGGPQAELLRRTAHWLVSEPELDETALRAHSNASDNGWSLTITGQSLHTTNEPVTLTDPQGQITQVILEAGKQPGVLSATVPVTQAGLYHVKDEIQEINVMVGASNAPEFGAMIATADNLPQASSLHWLQDGVSGPDIHRIKAGSAANGWNWIGLQQNGQYKVTGSKAYPFLPAWLLLGIILAAVLWAWWREGKSR